MGSCASAEEKMEQNRRGRYDPDVDSSCDECSDCASSDDEAIPYLAGAAPRRAALQKVSATRRSALGRAVARAAVAADVTLPPPRSQVVTLTLELAPAAFDEGILVSTVAAEADVEPTHVVLLSRPKCDAAARGGDAGTSVVRFVLECEDAATKGARLVNAIANPEGSKMHEKLPILAFTAAPSPTDGQGTSMPIDLIDVLHFGDDDTPSAAAQRETLVEDASARFWRLGSNKWRESIDVKHQQHGRYVYDLCLHGGNGYRKEIGYLSSMYDAWRFADAELGFRSTDRTWRGLHFLCMQHPGNDFLNGRFRHLFQGNRAMVSKEDGRGMTKESRAEFHHDMPKRLCYVSAITSDHDRLDRERFSHVRQMPGIRRKTMRRYVRQYIADFYRAVGFRALTGEDIDAAIAAGTAQVRFITTPVPPGEAGGGAASATGPKRLTVDDQAKAAAGRAAQFDVRQSCPLDRPVIDVDSLGAAAEKSDDGGSAADAELPVVVRRAVVTVPSRWQPPAESPSASWPPEPDTVLRAAAKLHQRLSRMEPSRDGNTRCMVVLINKLLCECGLSPAIFPWPDGAALRGHEEWVTEMRKGIELGDAAAAGADGFNETPLADKYLPENNQPREHTDDTPLCVRAEKAAAESSAALKEAAQFARRPWFADDLLDRHRAEPTRPSHVPPRAAFESPLGLDYKQKNAFFTK